MTGKSSVWVVDDDASIRWVLEKALSNAGFAVTLFDRADDVLKRIGREQPDVIVTDIRMPGTSGLELLDVLGKDMPGLPVIVMTAYSDLDSAVSAYQGGAFEYLPKPFDLEEAVALVGRALQKKAQVEVQVPTDEKDSEMIGAAPAMQTVFRVIGRLSGSQMNVLISGESGTGKELVARAIYRNSLRSAKPFVAINTAAIPADLLESELFGHEKGAFTGAVARRLGKFEEANGGTLLLDEISEMDPRLQAKLLRALQEREIDRVGGKSPVKVNVRIVATSNRNMEEAVAKGDFREDLFFRLNVMNLRLPELRERPEDVPVLAEYFVKKYAEANGVDELPICPDAMSMLCGHSWPGNVRELENTMHRAILLASGQEIDTDAIMLTDPQGAKNGPLATATNSGDGQSMVGRTVAEVERDLIIDTLTHCLGNRTHAANILGISIRTLRNKLKLYGDQGFTVPNPGEAGIGAP